MYYLPVSKSRKSPSEHAFELFASAMEELKKRGFSYMVTSAANQWTGSACEVFNGIRVHFEPYRAIQRVIRVWTTYLQNLIRMMDTFRIKIVD